MNFRKMMVGAGGIWFGILAANVGMSTLDELMTIGEAGRNLWPFLIYFYFLVLIAVALWEFLVERRSPKK